MSTHILLRAHSIIPIATASILLTLASFGRWPYWFYVLMRLVVCCVAAYEAITFRSRKCVGWMWAMLGLALLFNPVLPVHMSRADWRPLNLLGAGLLVAAAIHTRSTERAG